MWHQHRSSPRQLQQQSIPLQFDFSEPPTTMTTTIIMPRPNEDLKTYDVKEEGTSGTMLLPDVFPSFSRPFQPQGPPTRARNNPLTMDDWVVVDVYVDEGGGEGSSSSTTTTATNYKIPKVHLYLRTDDVEKYYVGDNNSNSNTTKKKKQYKYDRDPNDYSRCTIYCIRRTVRDIVNFLSGGDVAGVWSNGIESLQVGYHTGGGPGAMIDDLLDAINSGCTNLKSLSIHQASFNSRSLCTLMRTVHSTIENFDLLSSRQVLYNQQGEDDDQEEYGLGAISERIEACKFLRSVRLDQIYAFGLVPTILFALVGHDNIREIECTLRCGNCRTEMGYLALMVRTCPCLMKLSVNPDDLSRALGDMEVLVRGMKAALALSQLSLTKCPLDERDWRYLSQYLENCHRYPSGGLSTLKLSMPNDRDISCLCRNTTVKNLSLMPVTDTQVVQLLDENSSITNLELTNISQGTQELSSLPFSNHSLKKLSLFDPGAVPTFRFLLDWVDGNASAVEELQIIGLLPDPVTSLQAIREFIAPTSILKADTKPSKPMRSLRIQTVTLPDFFREISERVELKQGFVDAISHNPFRIDEIAVHVYVLCRTASHSIRCSTDFTWRLNKWTTLSQPIAPGQRLQLTAPIVRKLSDPSLIFHALRRDVLFDSLLERRPLPKSKKARHI